VLLCILFHSLGAEAANAGVQPTCPEVVRRVALVIGNGKYELSTYQDKHLESLKNPTNDALAIADKLKQVGFEPENIVLRLDVTTENVAQVMSDFNDRLSECSVAVFYYSGHGFSLNGDDYMPAVNAKIRTQFDVQQNSLSLSRILAMMEEAGVQTRIVLLDACRENPYNLPTKGVPGGGSGGLVPLNAPRGTEILYAAQPKSVAFEQSQSKYSFFTESLLKYIAEPNLTFDSLIKKVSKEVSENTNDGQVPYHNGDLIDDFYFIRTLAPTSPLPPTIVQNRVRASLRVAAQPDTIGLAANAFYPVDYVFAETKGIDVQIETEDSGFFDEKGNSLGHEVRDGRILGGSFQVDGGHQGIYHNNIWLPPDVASQVKKNNLNTVQLRHTFNCRDANGNEIHIPAVLRIVVQ